MESTNKNRRHTVRTGVFGKAWTGTNSPSITDSRVTTSFNDTFTGVQNPRWRHQVTHVSNATTAASGTRVIVSQEVPSGHAYWWLTSGQVGNPASKNNVQLDYAADVASAFTTDGVPIPSATSETTANNRAIEKLYEQISSFESSAQAGEDLGEIRQTVNLLRAPMKKLRDLTVRCIERHHHALGRPSVKEIVQGLGATALEYRFGVKPLVASFSDALVGLQNRDHLARYHPFRAVGVSENFSAGTTSRSGPGASLEVQVYRARRTTVMYEGVWGVRAGTDRRSVRDVLSLRFRDIVPTIWNLTPYSWLADYCSNIGTIANQFAIDWSDIAWCKKTVITENVNSFTYTRFIRPVNTFGFYNGLSPGYISWNTKSFTRSPQYYQPRPTLEIDLELSGGRLFNIAALVASRIPILRKATKRAVERHPSLQQAFAGEMRRRGTRIPYPFHT